MGCPLGPDLTRFEFREGCCRRINRSSDLQVDLIEFGMLLQDRLDSRDRVLDADLEHLDKRPARPVIGHDHSSYCHRRCSTSRGCGQRPRTRRGSTWARRTRHIEQLPERSAHADGGLNCFPLPAFAFTTNVQQGAEMARTGPFFTEAARSAAVAARQRRATLKVQVREDFEVFVTRVSNRFAWEIRKFGGIAIATSSEEFTSPTDALSAGQSAREAMKAEAMPV